MEEKRKKIFLVGGGTLGSVSPLLAIAEKYDADYVFVGTQSGPERSLVESYGLDFVSISSGKLRRYFSGENFKDIFKLIKAFGQSLKLLHQHKPDVVLTAGSFVAVPMVWAAWFLRIPSVVHQQDILVGLANKLMAPFAKKITVVFEQQKKDFKIKKVIVTGNPVRQPRVNSKDQKPIVLITGGGLGARNLNDFVAHFVPMLTREYEVHHILGQKNWEQKFEHANYHTYKFVKEGMIDLMARAEIIISRAGMGFITEAASLKKALVLIPIPHSHQERNAAFFAKQNAAFMVRQGSMQIMDRYLQKLLRHKELRDGAGENLYNIFPHHAVDNYIKLIKDISK